MHVFILVLIAFYLPHDGQPETARTTGAIVPTLAACQALGEATSSQVAQMKGVSDVHYACIEAQNENDKAA